MGGSFGKNRGASGRDPGDLYDRFKANITPHYGDLLNNIENNILSRPDNPFLGGLTRDLEGVQARSLDVQRGIDQLPGTLRSTALAESTAANQAGVMAARDAAGGRGGLAYGGGAGAIAARTATSSAPGRSAALYGALTTAEGLKSNLLGQQTGIAAGLSQARGVQAGLSENRIMRNEDLRIGARQNFLNLLGGIAGGAISGAGGSPSKPSKGFNIAGGGEK